MIALLVGLALADPCAREVVLSRGLELDPLAATATAELDLDLVLRKRKIDGIPTWILRRARAEWTWRITADTATVARSQVGDGAALCEGEVHHSEQFAIPVGESTQRSTVNARGIDACRLRVALEGTQPGAPSVRLQLHGPTPPGAEAPLDGPLEIIDGQDLVVDIPGCM